MTRNAFRLVAIAFVLLVSTQALAVDASKFRQMYIDKDYEGLAALCESSAAEIEKSEFLDRILYYCGMAKLKLYEKNRNVTDLTDAIDYLERSYYLYYLPSTSHALGQARLLAADLVSSREEQLAMEWQALDEMWDAIIKRHAEENFRTDVLSDTLLSWSISYYEALLTRVMRDEDDPARLRWLTARIRMLTDRYKHIDPSKGENETRRLNLQTISDWMKDLYHATYFDNNVVVGAYKFMGDRTEEKYDQTEETEDKFHEALRYYKEGLFRAKSPKAKAVLNERISYLCTLYQSESKDKKIEFYKMGFYHALDGLKQMEQVAKTRPEKHHMFYRFEQPNAEVVASLQKNYGHNLSGLLYFLWERGDYKSVVALRRHAFEADFGWKTKHDDLLRIADAAAKLARQNIRNRLLYDKYKEMCLTSAFKAFMFTLEKFKGQRPTYDEAMCTAYQVYSTFLASFGEVIESANLDRIYGPICEKKPEAGGEAKASSQSQSSGE